MSIKSLFKSKLWLFPLAYILFFLTEAIADVFYEHGVLYTYIIFVFLSFFVLFILALIKSFKTKSDIHWLAVVVAFLLVFFWQDIRSHTSLLMQSLKVNLNPQLFSECVKNATPIPDGGAIGICERKGYEIWYAVITEAIIYDSSDQIVNTYAHRSGAWNQTAYRLFHRKAKFSDMGYKATKLFGHYYYVYFSTDLKMDFGPDASLENESLLRRQNVETIARGKN